MKAIRTARASVTDIPDMMMSVFPAIRDVDLLVPRDLDEVHGPAEASAQEPREVRLDAGDLATLPEDDRRIGRRDPDAQGVGRRLGRAGADAIVVLGRSQPRA